MRSLNILTHCRKELFCGSGRSVESTGTHRLVSGLCTWDSQPHCGGMKQLREGWDPCPVILVTPSLTLLIYTSFSQIGILGAGVKNTLLWTMRELTQSHLSSKWWIGWVLSASQDLRLPSYTLYCKDTLGKTNNKDIFNINIRCMYGTWMGLNQYFSWPWTGNVKLPFTESIFTHGYHFCSGVWLRIPTWVLIKSS